MCLPTIDPRQIMRRRVAAIDPRQMMRKRVAVRHRLPKNTAKLHEEAAARNRPRRSERGSLTSRRDMLLKKVADLHGAAEDVAVLLYAAQSGADVVE